MRRVLLLFAALAAFAAAGAQPAGRAEHGPDRETFVYAVRDGDSLRLDRYPALSSAAGARPCMIFPLRGRFPDRYARQPPVPSLFPPLHRAGVRRRVDRLPAGDEAGAGCRPDRRRTLPRSARFDACDGHRGPPRRHGVRLPPCRGVGRGPSADPHERFECRGHDGPDGRIRPLQRRFRLCTSPPGRVPVCRGNRLCRSRVRSVGRTAVDDASRAAAALPRRRRPECALRHRSGPRRRRAVRLGRRRPRPRAARRAVLVRLRGRRRPFDGLAADARTLRRDRRLPRPFRFRRRATALRDPYRAARRPRTARGLCDRRLPRRQLRTLCSRKKRQPSETFRKGYRQ